MTIISDAQAAIVRMVSGEPVPGQKYALKARELAQDRTGDPGEDPVRTSHKGIPFNDRADKWARWRPVSRTSMGWSGSGSGTSTCGGIARHLKR